MSDFLVNNIITAPMRLVLLVLGLFILYQFIVQKPLNTYDYRYFLDRFSIYGASLLIIVFVLIQLKIYDMFSLLALFIFLVLFRYFSLKELMAYSKGGGRFRRAALLAFFKSLEKRNGNFKKSYKEVLVPRKVNWGLVLIIAIGCSAIFTRMVFLENDNYTFSTLWVQTLEIVKNFDNNQWFVRGRSLVVGELALINLYANLVGISKEMAIYTFGLLEIFFVTSYMFYLVHSITKANFLGPTIAGLAFAFLFAWLPININILFKHSSIYLSLFFAIPFMHYTFMRFPLNSKVGGEFWVKLVLSIAIALSDFFVMFIIIPLFLIATFMFNRRQGSIKKSILAFVSGAVIVLGFKVIESALKNVDFFNSFLSNIIVFERYSYMPQLLTTTENLNLIYFGLGLFSLGSYWVLRLVFNLKYREILTFTIFYLMMLIAQNLGLPWLDKDLFNQALTLFVPVMLGINICMCQTMLTSISSKRVVMVMYTTSILIVAVFTCITSYSHSLKWQKFQEVNRLKTDLLKVYDELATSQMNNNYAVVNKAYGVRLSGQEHLFINYDDFLKDYVKRDSIYKVIKENKELLLKYPQLVLPKSVFVFISDTTRITNEDFFLKTPGPTAISIEAQINHLKKRGTKITTFFQSSNLKVYELSNTKNGSDLNKMIFEYEAD